MQAWAFDAIGTRWQVDTAAPLGDDARSTVLAVVDRFDRDWSRFRSDSWVSRVAAVGGEHPVPADAAELFALYDEFDDLTDGAVNPLAGAALVALGYDAAYSLVPTGSPVGVPAWTSVRRAGGTIEVDPPTWIDVGAAGKGRLVDLVSAALAAVGAPDHTVDASGDLLHRGTDPVRVALEHPVDPSRAIGVVEVPAGSALCGSASNRRAWGDGLHHVVDARTGRPTADVVATWVVADSCMLADGLATAHFFAEPEVLRDRFDHRFVRVHADGRVRWSPDLPGEVFA